MAASGVEGVAREWATTQICGIHILLQLQLFVTVSVVADSDVTVTCWRNCLSSSSLCSNSCKKAQMYRNTCDISNAPILARLTQLVKNLCFHCFMRIAHEKKILLMHCLCSIV
jgi:hypothetical protein